jgi:hypothetical protein
VLASSTGKLVFCQIRRLRARAPWILSLESLVDLQAIFYHRLLQMLSPFAQIILICTYFLFLKVNIYNLHFLERN